MDTGGLGRAGADYYETEVTLEELIDIMFEDLELPDLERKALRSSRSIRCRQAQGLPRRSASASASTSAAPSRERAKRQMARPGGASGSRRRRPRRRGLQPTRRFPFHDRDLVYRHVTTDVRNESNAVVLCLMDTSGSMDTMKKYLARSFFFLLYQFICTKYRTSRSRSSPTTPRPRRSPRRSSSTRASPAAPSSRRPT